MMAKRNMPKAEDYEKDAQYELGEVIPSSDVPSWARRTSKWEDLITTIEELKPGETQTVKFPDKKTATRARNTIRDTINLRLNSAVIRTRVTQQGGKAIVYFTRLKDDQVVEEERVDPVEGKEK